jgi:SAM-dependent methyltransferase
MFGSHYELALAGEKCWLRGDDGHRVVLPVRRWLGHHDADRRFDEAVVAMCEGPTIDLGCGPGRLVAQLIAHGLPALGVDQSATAVALANGRGAPALHGNLFDALPGIGAWHTALLIDGNIGLGGDPVRVLTRAAELLSPMGHCIAEFEPALSGVYLRRVRLECDTGPGPWFSWASVGLDSAADLAAQTGLHLVDVRHIADRALARLAKTP